MSKKKIALFFGAGAEISYGLPSGGKFALDIFKLDPTEDKEKFKSNRDKIDKTSVYAASWLPEKYNSKPITTFGRSNYVSLVESSLENKRTSILDFLNDFDKNAKAIEGEFTEKNCNLKKALEEITSQNLGSVKFSQVVKLTDQFGDNNKLFDSKYFSSILQILKTEGVDKEFKKKLKKIARSVMELLIGACGEDLISKLNDGIFEQKPEGIDLFDDLGGIFSLDYKSTGLTGLEIVLESETITLNDTTGSQDIILEFGRRVLEEIYARALDYQSLMDLYWRYLYCPKTDWSRFCKVSIFLNTVRRYIFGLVKNTKVIVDSGDGYYHDIKKMICEADIIAVGTTNYNKFIDEIIEPKVYFLNGSVDDYYDPYLNKIIDASQIKDSHHFYVPFLFTQSGTKPLTTVHMSKRYVEMYEKFKNADQICVIGYGFNIDDGHINGMFRELIETEKKKLTILNYCADGNEDMDKIKEEYQNKLRITDADNLDIIQVKSNRKTIGEDKWWYEEVLARLA